jgi:hypothetical protein
MATTPTKLKIELVKSGRFPYKVGRACEITDTRMCTLVVGYGFLTKEEFYNMTAQKGIKIER